MRTFLSMLVAVVLFTTIISSCAGTPQAKTYTDPSKPIDVSLNQEFIIALDSNPSTGYSWQESHDEAIIKLEGKSFKQGEAAEKGLVGAGGTEIFRFKVLNSGATKITLVYKRPWEQPTSQDKTSEFKINVSCCP